jgi:hypothetical protein
MLEITNHLRPYNPIRYPNYHIGNYFEEFFFKKFISENNTLNIGDYNYIPIFWTNCYMDMVFGQKKDYKIQETLNKLDKNKKYFTVSQHDDCVNEILPHNTIVFSMGGNKTGDNIIPIPLICSPIQKITNKKDILISFVGSLTHPIRKILSEKYSKDKNFCFETKDWQLISEEDSVKKFIDITSRSFFTLSPRGYGKTSFRLYESMQLDSIPIYVYDEEWLPWKDSINWDDLIVKVHVSEIDNIVNKIQDVNVNKMLKYKNEIYDDYFTYEGTYKNIIKILKK